MTFAVAAGMAPAFAVAFVRMSGSWPYSAVPGQSVLQPSRWPLMRCIVTGVP